MACETNGTYKGANMWLFHSSMKGSSAAALKTRQCQNDNPSTSSPRQEEAVSRTYPWQAIYLLQTYASDDVMPETDTTLPRYTSFDYVSKAVWKCPGYQVPQMWNWSLRKPFLKALMNQAAIAYDCTGARIWMQPWVNWPVTWRHYERYWREGLLNPKRDPAFVEIQKLAIVGKGVLQASLASSGSDAVP